MDSMLPEIGHLALILALFSTITPFIAFFLKRMGNTSLAAFMIESAVLLQAMCVVLAFGILVHAYIVSDFSILNVASNSHTTKPLLYKITATWGNHEGSMLLWMMILAVITLIFGMTASCDRERRATILSVQLLLSAGLLLFILLTSNPFIRIFPVPTEGQGFNPLLQDVGLAIHPPTLYLGYVGFSLGFSWAIASLYYRAIEADWIRAIRPFMLASWAFLTLGIGLGSWWAYRELGWGGFWFWDPVENASLMPWLVGTALIHALVTTEKRQTLKGWTVLLALITFCLSLLGTFLVRSGALTSVHAFANDPARGFFILAFLSLVLVAGLFLFAMRAHLLGRSATFAPVSRESLMLLNNVLLVVACSTVMLGTLYPLGLELFTGAKIAVGAPYFSATFIPLLLPVVILAGIGPMISWQQDRLKRYRFLYFLWGIGAVFVAALVKILLPLTSFGTLIGLASGLWLIVASLMQLQLRIRLFAQKLDVSLKELAHVPLKFYAMIVAHLGAGVLVIGITMVTSFSEEKETVMLKGEQLSMKRFVLTLEQVNYGKVANYYKREGVFLVKDKAGNTITTLTPERRLYVAEKSQTTESALYSTWKGDLYVAIGDETETGHLTVRAYFRPFINWIWAGVCLMVLGGMCTVASFMKRKRS